jgi:endogenous inhibitor of DNA gyrase (YacG/DUF329 family)
VDLPTRKCPGCGRAFRPVPGSPWRPFCSERCQLIDLGGWLTERHAIPGDEAPPEAGAEPSDETP